MFIAPKFARTSGITHPQQCFPFQSKEFMSRHIVLYLDVTRPCTIFFNSQANAHQNYGILLVFEQTDCAKIDAIHCLQDKSLGKHLSHSLLEIKWYIFFTFRLKAWNGQPNTSGLFYLLSEFHLSFVQEKSNKSCLSFHKTFSIFWLVSKNIIFFLFYLPSNFSLLLFLCCTCQGENPVFLQVQGIPKKANVKIFVWLGGTGYNIMFSYFKKKWIFGGNYLIFWLEAVFVLLDVKVIFF